MGGHGGASARTLPPTLSCSAPRPRSPSSHLLGLGGGQDSLRHIADIAVMEQRLPKQEGQEEMTLWDKEDMAVRMVLEEGKLNMCLRVLQEYKALVRPAGAFGAAAGAAAGTLGIPEGEVGSKMCIFEESIGLLLHCAMKSVEA